MKLSTKALRSSVSILAIAAAGYAASSTGAQASLSLFQQFSGPGELVSTDGCGTSTASCNILSDIQAGSSIQAAFLYSSTFSASTNPNGITLSQGASTVTPTFTPLGVNNGFLQAWRANVTSFVQANATIGGLTTWTANEGGLTSALDGESLVIVYKNTTVQPTTSTVAVVDGFSSSSGDTSHISFSPLPAGFSATMAIGDGFSFDGPSPNNPTNSLQSSTITVNGTTLTNVAGHCDDDVDGPNSCRNGNLFTMGAQNAGPDNDPFTPFPNPGIAQDHEFYNLGNILNVGDTSATLTTVNPSGDDNIFVEVFDLSVAANVVTNPTPEPGSLAIWGAALAGLGFIRRRRKST